MGLYAYQAVDQSGRILSGRMPASNLLELEARLQGSGLDLVRARAEGGGGFLRRRKVGRKDLINLCFHLQQSLRAGVLITDALYDLIEGMTAGTFRDILTAVMDSVRGGAPLSVAMGEFPEVFDVVFIGLLRAGEESGELPAVFEKLTVSLKWQDELLAQMRRLLTYPAFTFLVLLGVFGFMMIYLVPQLAGFIRSTGQALPLQTRVLLALSDFLVAHWGLVLMLPVVGFVSVRGLFLLGGEPLRKKVDRIVLRLPVIGRVLEMVVMARVVSLFGMLYASGVPVLDSLGICRNAAGNRWIRDNLEQVREAIVQGSRIADAFASIGIFPSLVIRMLRVGESTGEIDMALTNVAYFYARDIQESVSRVQVAIEPLMTLCLGALLGWLMMAVLGPVYELISHLKV